MYNNLSWDNAKMGVIDRGSLYKGLSFKGVLGVHVHSVIPEVATNTSTNIYFTEDYILVYRQWWIKNT